MTAAAARAPRRLQIVAPVNRACVAAADGRCLACDAPQGEPCRQRPAANDHHPERKTP